MERSVKGEVISSTFDEPARRHVQVAEMVMEKAKRLVEHKKDVVILLDSITRLARAYNIVVPHSGKILSGGVDANALRQAQTFLRRRPQYRGRRQPDHHRHGADRYRQPHGRSDFRGIQGHRQHGTALDRNLSNRRIFPAIDINKSGTRKEDLLLPPEELNRVWILRKYLDDMGPTEAMEFLSPSSAKPRPTRISLIR